MGPLGSRVGRTAFGVRGVECARPAGETMRTWTHRPSIVRRVGNGESMMNSRMWVYAWDFLDEGVDVVLDRLHGELGIDGVTMPVTAAPARYLRVREVEPRWIDHPGGIFFTPDEQRYQSTRCKPTPAPGVKAHDLLSKVAEACQERRMALFASVSASRIGRMAERHGEMAAINALGARSNDSLCLASPDVRAMLCDLLRDITESRSIAGVILEDMDIAWTDADAPAPRRDAAAHDDTDPFAHGATIPLGDAGRALLRLCFCPSCVQGAESADVDAVAAKRSVQVMLHRALDAGPDGAETNLAAVLSDNPPLAGMLGWRRTSLAEFCARCVEACSAPITVRVGTGQQAEIFRDKRAGNPASIIALERLAPPTWSERIAGAAWESRCGPALLRSTAPAELVRGFQSLAAAGCRSIELAHYGIVPESMHSAIKQAVRFDRRADADA